MKIIWIARNKEPKGNTQWSFKSMQRTSLWEFLMLISRAPKFKRQTNNPAVTGCQQRKEKKEPRAPAFQECVMKMIHVLCKPSGQVSRKMPAASFARGTLIYEWVGHLKLSSKAYPLLRISAIHGFFLFNHWSFSYWTILNLSKSKNARLAQPVRLWDNAAQVVETGEQNL